MMKKREHHTKWWRIALLLGVVALTVALTACSSGVASASRDSLPPGDASRGERLFAQSVNGAPPCSTCHSLDDRGGIGPSIAGYSQLATNRIVGLSATDYTFESIVQPTSHVVSGYPNIMYARYGNKLSSQDIADLIAYMLSID